jgi:hypothetical protein
MEIVDPLDISCENISQVFVSTSIICPVLVSHVKIFSWRSLFSISKFSEIVETILFHLNVFIKFSAHWGLNER